MKRNSLLLVCVVVGLGWLALQCFMVRNVNVNGPEQDMLQREVSILQERLKNCEETNEHLRRKETQSQTGQDEIQVEEKSAWKLKYDMEELKGLTARELVEKVSSLNVRDLFHQVLTKSSIELTKREQERVGMPIDESKVQRWMFEKEGRYKSTPYQITIPEDEPTPPNPISFNLPPPIITRTTDAICSKLKSNGHDKLCDMFRKCFPNTLETTTSLLADNTTYVITGDIDLMWLRDSSAQVHQYLLLPEVVADPSMQLIVEGLIRRQLIFIQRDPYGSSFRPKLRGEDDLGDFHVGKARNLYVAMHNYELDSVCYPMVLAYQWWKASGSKTIFTDEWKRVAEIIMVMWIVEQYHDTISPYTYLELTRDGGKWSSPVKYTGMTWCSFRPSDDQTEYGYLVPANMFAVVALGYMREIFLEVYKDEYLALVAQTLAKEIDDGIHKHAVKNEAGYGKVYAYEVDGFGGYKIMDDANVPSLLSIPYLGYKSPHDPTGEIARNTRRIILSNKNPYYFEGSYGKGIGSPHTYRGYIWHMSLIMQALTSDDRTEIMELFEVLQNTDAGMNFMHESFSASNPAQFSRAWFAWANSLFSELVIDKLDLLV